MKHKRFRFLWWSAILALGFYGLQRLPYGWNYLGSLLGLIVVPICFLYGLKLGKINDLRSFSKGATLILPTAWFGGYALFVAMLPPRWWVWLLVSIIYGAVNYLIFLIENILLIAIGTRTPLLYRSAYTTGFIISLVSIFCLFNNLLSFKMGWWVNMIVGVAISMGWLAYHFWAVTIELSDDGASREKWVYIAVPALLIGQLTGVWSFWPTGIFKGSIYLTAVVYVIGSLLELELRGRLQRRQWVLFSWLGLGVFLGAILATSWG